MSVEPSKLHIGITRSSLKFAVLGNCQMGHVTRCLQALLGGEWPTNEWVTQPLLQAMSDGRRDLIPYFEAHDKVFIQPWVWKSLEGRYAQLRHKVILYPHIEFPAYHPDLAYVLVASTGLFFDGPGGHYQSSIALMAWKCGLSTADALKLYHRKIYQRLGYFDRWRSSTQALLAEGKLVGLSLEGRLKQWTDRGCFMHSINHPKLFVIADVVADLLRKEGIPTLPDDSMQFVRDYLADSVVWPVYPEVAANLRIPGSYLFKLSSPGIRPDQPVRTLGLKEFVEHSYAAFSQHAPDNLVCGPFALPQYAALMAELASPGKARVLLDSLTTASPVYRERSSTQVDVTPIHMVEFAQTEEARTLFRPASAFWHGSV